MNSQFWIYLAIASLIGGLVEIALHYAFHPRLGRRLGKLTSYIAGTTAWLAPFCIFAFATGGWAYTLAALVITGAAGAVVVATNLYDELLESRQISEDKQRLESEAERIFGNAQDD